MLRLGSSLSVSRIRQCCFAGSLILGTVIQAVGVYLIHLLCNIPLVLALEVGGQRAFYHLEGLLAGGLVHEADLACVGELSGGSLDTGVGWVLLPLLLFYHLLFPNLSPIMRDRRTFRVRIKHSMRILFVQDEEFSLLIFHRILPLTLRM